MLEEAAKAKNGLQMTGTTTATLVVPEEALASQRTFVVVQALQWQTKGQTASCSS